MNKGITPVIAIILLLVIVIAIAGFVFVLFQKTIESTGAKAQSAVDSLADSMANCANIENVAGMNIYVRNCGTNDITSSSFSFYAIKDGVSRPLSSNGAIPIPENSVNAVPVDFAQLVPGYYNIKLVTNGGYISIYRNVYINGSSFLLPVVSLNNPNNNELLWTPVDVQFGCSATAYGANTITSIELYTNVSGTWQKDFETINSGNLQFTANNVPAGRYTWNCRATDNASISGWGSNYEFRVMLPGVLPPPSITYQFPPNNVNYVAPVNVNFSCSASASGANTITALELWTDYDNFNPTYVDPTPTDGSLSYTFPWMSSTNHWWSCRADDNDTATDEGWGDDRYIQIAHVPHNPPVVSLLEPSDTITYRTPVDLNFSCFAESDPALNLVIPQMRLYSNITGIWGQLGALYSPPNPPLPRNGTRNYTTKMETPGIYKWNCEAYDNTSYVSFAQTNKTFLVEEGITMRIYLNSPADNWISSPGNYTFKCSTDTLLTDQKIQKTDLIYSRNSGPLIKAATNYPYKKNFLAPNSDFEYSIDNSPVFNVNNETSWPYCIGCSLSADHHEGSGSLRLDNNGKAVRYLTTNWNTTGRSTLKPGTTYYLSNWVKVPYAGSFAQIKIYTGSASTGSVVLGSVTGPAPWTQVNGQFTTGSSVVNASINLTFSGNVGEYALFDALQIEEIEQTNYTDSRTYRVYEETNDTCEPIEACIDVAIPILYNFSGINIGETNANDNLWGNITFSGDVPWLDNDALVCYDSEECYGNITLPVESGDYNIEIYAKNPDPGVSLQISTDKTTWYPINGDEKFYIIANKTITMNAGGAIRIFARKINSGGTGAAYIDRIRLYPNWLYQYYSVFTSALGTGNYAWNCNTTDVAGRTAVAPYSYTLIVV